MTLRGGRYVAIVRGEDGKIGGAVGELSPERLMNLARSAAAGMYLDGHVLREAVRGENSLDCVTMCEVEIVVPLPYRPMEMKGRTRADVRCARCRDLAGRNVS